MLEGGLGYGHRRGHLDISCAADMTLTNQTLYNLNSTDHMMPRHDLTVAQPVVNEKHRETVRNTNWREVRNFYGISDHENKAFRSLSARNAQCITCLSRSVYIKCLRHIFLNINSQFKLRNASN